MCRGGNRIAPLFIECLFAVLTKLAGPDVAGWMQAVTSIGGLGESLNESAAERPRVWFGYDSVEPARGRLYALQKLVRSVRTGARAVTVAFPHRSLNDALSNGWLSPTGDVPVDTLIMLDAAEWRGMLCAFSTGCRPGRSR